MGIFDRAKEQAEKLMEEHGDKIEQPSDQAFDRLAAEANERTGGQHAEHVERARGLADSHVGTSATETEAERSSSVLDAPGVPDTAHAASGPTQATTSGTGPAPAAGQDAPGASSAGLTDSVAASEDAARAPAPPESSGEPGANGGLSTESDADPVTSLAEDLGLAPGATDAVDPGQDNGLNT